MIVVTPAKMIVAPQIERLPRLSTTKHELWGWPRALADDHRDLHLDY